MATAIDKFHQASARGGEGDGSEPVPELPAGVRLYRKGDLGGRIGAPSDKALVGPIGEWLDLVVPETESSLAAVGGGVLAALGAWLGNEVYLMVGKIVHRTNLFVVVVGPSSFARKGTAWGAVTDVIEELDSLFLEKNVTGGFGSGEALIHAVQDEAFNKGGELVRGSKDQRRVFNEGEYAKILRVGNRDGSILNDVLRVAYDGGSPLFHNTIRGGSVVSSNHHVSMFAGITPEELNLHITEVSALNGFVNRNLWVWSNNHDLLPDGGDDPYVGRIVETILAGRKSGHINYDRTPEAVDWWRERYETLRNLEHVPDRLRPLVSRTTDFVQRIALIYAATEGAVHVEVRHLEAGLTWAEHSIETAGAVLGGVVSGQIAAKVLHSLREHPSSSSSRTDLFQAIGRSHTAAELDAALSDLESRGLIFTWKGEGKSEGGPKPTMTIATTKTGISK